MTTWGNWSTVGGNSFRIGWDAAIDDGNRMNMWLHIQNQYNVSGDAINISWDGTFTGSATWTLTASTGGETLILATVPGRMSYNSTATVNFHVRNLYNGSAPDVQMNVWLGPLLPNAPTLAASTYVSDTQVNTTWTNNPASDRPYDNIAFYRRDSTAPDTVIAWPGGTATSYNDTGVVADRKLNYIVTAVNSAGATNSNLTNTVYTTPAAPTACTAAKSGSDIVINWTNNSVYASEAPVEIWHAANGVWDGAALATLAANSVTYTHIAPSTSVTHTYRVRAKTPSGTTLYSTYATSGVVQLLAAPNAPTNLLASSSSYAKTVYRINLSPNPSCETDITGWTNWAGTGGAVTATRQTTGGKDGTAFYRGSWTSAAAANTGGLIPPNATVTGLIPYTMSMWIRPSATRIFAAQYQFYNGATPTGSGAGTPVSCAANVWTQVSVVGNSAAGDTQVQLRAYSGDPSTLPIGFTLDGDAVVIEANAPNMTYFAGTIPDYAAASDATYATTLTWTHNPVDSTPQTAYEVQYQLSTDSGSTWGTAVSTGQVTSGTSTKIYSANTWTNGALKRVRWQVRTWGSYAGATPYSAWSAYHIIAPSTTPVAVVTSSSTYTTPVLAVTGTYTDAESSAQTGALWTLRNSTGNVLETALLGQADSAKFLAYTFSYVPADGTTYTVAYQVQDTTGIWSAEATKGITVTYAQAPTPVISSITFSVVTGKVTGVLSNPAPTGGQVAAVSNRVYRDGVPVAGLEAVAPNGTFIDIPPLNATVIYSVYAVSSIPSYSTPATSTVTTLSAPLVQVVTPPTTPAGWYVDGVNLSTLAFNIENRSAGWSMSAPIGENIKVPGRNGSFYVSDKPFDETDLNLNMWALGATTDGLIPKDIPAQQQCLRNLDGLSSIFGRGRLLEVKRSSALADEGLVNRVINPSFQGSSPISDWKDLVPGWAARTTTNLIYNYFNNPNMSTLNTTLSKYTDATRTAITLNGVSKYAAVKTAGGTGALSITLTGNVTSSLSSSWVVGATLWDSPSAPALTGNIAIQVQLKSGSIVTSTTSSSVQYVRGKVFYVFVEPLSTVVYDNYVVTFTTDSVLTGVTFGVVDPFFNSARAWTQGLAGDMAITASQAYMWAGTANDSVSVLSIKSKFGYAVGSSPRIIDGQDIGASLTSLSEYNYAPYLTLAGPNNQEIVLSVDATGVAGQWVYFNLDADLTRTPFNVRLELWNSGNLVAFQPYGLSDSGPTSLSTDGMMRAPGAFSRVIIRFSPSGVTSAVPQFYIGGQKIQINNLTLMLEAVSPLLTTGYVPRYFPSEQLTSASVTAVTPRSYSGYMLVAPKTGSVAVSITDGTTVQGPYTITEPTVINPAWASAWTYSVTPNGNLYHLSTGYRASDSTTLLPPMWDGTRFVDSPVWNSNKQISNTSGWVNVLSNAVRSASAYLPVGTTTYTYTSPIIALEAGTTRLSGSLTLTPKIGTFTSISSSGVRSSVSYTLSTSLVSYTTAAGASPTVLKTQAITAPTTVSWIDVPISTGYAGVKTTLTVTSSVAIPFGPLFYLSDFMLVTTPTTRSTPVPFFDGDTTGCSWAGIRYMSPSIYGGSIRRAMAEVSDAIDFSSMAGGSRAVFNVAMKIPNVFWEDPATTTATSTASIPAGTNYEIPLTQFSGSSAPIEDAVVQISILSGTAGVLNLTDKATGATLVFTKAFTAGSTLTITGGTADDNSYTAIDQDGNSLVPYLIRRNTSRFLPLTPMTPLQVENAQAPVLVLRSDGTITATVAVTGHRKFFLA